MNDAAPLVLQHDADRCEIYPRLGGSIGRWAVGGQEMFRVASASAIAACDPFGMATFPLVPYSNRIGYARFEWASKPVALRLNFMPEPHAIHGVGWKREWSVTTQSKSAVTLHLTHAADDDWPWAFEAEQRIALTDDTLTLTLRASNLADASAPLAFGHHPYFDKSGATLVFTAQNVWMSGQDRLPTEAVIPRGQFDFGTASPVAGRNIDNCYDGVTGPSVISWAGRPQRLEIASSPPLPAAVVFVPEDGDAFCFEPVPHTNNAVNMPPQTAAMPVLAAGETSETIVTFKASKS